jgi:hypothetical protein
MEMSTQSLHESRQPRVYDYSAAIAKAVEWLGDRYLLAKPINAQAIRRAAPAAIERPMIGIIDDREASIA